MTGSAKLSSGLGKPTRKRPFPFGLVMLLFGLGLGFYGGIAATKRAMKAPPWVQRIFGISYTAPVMAPTPAPVAAQPQPAPTPIAAVQSGSTPNPAAEVGAGFNVGAPDSMANLSPTTKLEKPEPTAQPEKHGKKRIVDSRDLLGTWNVTDRLPSDVGAANTVRSTYVFNSDNTGEFDSDGKKLYDFRWKPAGDDIAVDYDGEGPDPNQPWSVKLKWSLNDDRTVLTLVPMNGKDPRGFVYSLGPGVYRKSNTGSRSSL